MAVAFVSGTVSSIQTNPSSYALPSVSTTAGALIVVGSASNTNAVTSITDTIGNTYTLVKQYVPGGSNFGFVEMWATISGGTNANNVITINLAGVSNYAQGALVQYSGVLSKTQDQLQFTVAAGATSITSPSFTPTETGEVAVLFGEVGQTDTLAAGTNYTGRTTGSSVNVFFCDRLSAPASSQTASFTDGIAGGMALIVATFKATSNKEASGTIRAAGFTLLGSPVKLAKELSGLPHVTFALSGDPSKFWELSGYPAIGFLPSGDPKKDLSVNGTVLMTVGPVAGTILFLTPASGLGSITFRLSGTLDNVDFRDQFFDPPPRDPNGDGV